MATKIKGTISVSIQDKQILNDIAVDFEQWKNYCLVGKNGSGKSTLLAAIMWNPSYEVTWSLEIWDTDLLSMKVHERAKLWIFCAFQSIPDIPWVKLFEFLRTIYNARFWSSQTFLSFKKIIEPLVAQFDIDREFLFRDVNVWFSGGERRKLEVLQIALLKPTWIMLDEIDSWLDINAFKTIATYLRSIDSLEVSFIIVTHYFEILQYITIDTVIIMKDWSIIQQWWNELIDTIQSQWFE